MEKAYHPDMPPNIPISVQAVVVTEGGADKESASKAGKAVTVAAPEISL